MGGLPICQVHSASCWVGGLCSSSGGSRGILHLGAQSLAQGSQTLPSPFHACGTPLFTGAWRRWPCNHDLCA